MKNAVILFKVGGLLMAGLGLLHLSAHMFGPSPEAAPVFESMKSFEIEVMGTYTLLQFYLGFSLMMGTLLIVYGGSVWFTNERVFNAMPRHSFLFNIIGSLVLFLLTLVYFHPLAYGLCCIAFLSFSASYYKRARI